ncbi:N-acetylglucosaminyl-phosphatidylinositol de-N-acetylase [Lepisosteus oculatus]|uniref:N-acetylglucosaminyl-phosphatidylinositol de-N-acetylase n=1 Tax=Lepisosteus oculatus TaxID=7918 RepID=UPI00371ED387
MVSLLLAVVLLFIVLYVWITRIYHQHRQTVAKSGSAHLVSLIKSVSRSDRGFSVSRNKYTNDGTEWQFSDESQTFNGLRALFVTAHPDDECMFFSPAVIRLLEINASVHLLCLSSGNYYSQGEVRKKELLKSCEVFGIPPAHVTVIENRELPDDPNVQWDIHLVSSLILKHVKAAAINLVLTFDGSGVSGHANHIALYRSLRYLVSTGKMPEGCAGLALETVSIFRKYLSVLELPVSWLRSSDFICVIGREEYTQAKRAMFCHQSQLLWFRQIYLLLSRYMSTNTFQRIAKEEEKRLKVY